MYYLWRFVRDLSGFIKILVKMAADLTKLQVRNGHRTHAVKLMDKSKKDSQMPLQDVKILLSLIKKQQILDKLK